MTPAVHVVEHGRAATQALASTIVAAKDGRALAPVTVIVPSNLAGLFARRLLGSGDVAGMASGLANVQFVTPFRLAELLSADVLTERRPLTNPVLASAVRRTLAEGGHPFGDAAQHIATTTAVSTMYARLSQLSPAARDSVAAVDWGGRMVALHDRIGARLEGFDDEDAVADAASTRADLQTAVMPFGHLVWHLPGRVTHALSELLRSCFVGTPSSVIVGLTGDEQADAPALAACERAGVNVDDVRASPAGPPAGARIVVATDADEEVRSVVRQVWQLAAEGVRLDRMAIVYPARVPYLRTLLTHCAAADLPVNGPAAETLADSVAGQVLTLTLALPASRWRRDRVMALVAAGPLRTVDGRVRPAAWERLSREAGVVRRLDDWQLKLRAHAEEVRQTASATDDDGWARRLQLDADELARLAEFVAHLGDSLDRIDAADTWATRVAATRQLMTELLGTDRDRQRWPVSEQLAADRITDSLGRLAALDEIEPGVTDEVFRQAVEAELDAPTPRHGTFGIGVSLVPLAAAVGLDLDAVFVVGMAEGLCPSMRRAEALLPEEVRSRTAGELETPDEEFSSQHRNVLAALAAAPASRRQLSYAKGDLRDGRRRLASRWLVDTATTLVGRHLLSGTLEDIAHPAVDHQVSYVANLRDWASAPALTERDVGAVLVTTERGVDAMAHPSCADVMRAIASQRARRSPSFTEWDGNLAGHSIPSPAALTPMSPTRLESWAECGYRYFAAYVLGLSQREDPEQIIDLSPRERGSALHLALERFLAEMIQQRAPRPDEVWSDSQRLRLHELADAEFDRLHAAGLTGRPLLWRRQRIVLHRRLDQFLADDDERRRTRRTLPVTAELAFGLHGADPIGVPLPDGRELRFRGRIDRLDETDDGTAVVYDYKSGSGSRYEALRTKKNQDPAEVDPVAGGTMLQLGVYAEAARQVRGTDAADAYFWLLESAAKDKFVGVNWDETRRRRLLDVTSGIVDAIEAGGFPLVPGEWHSFFQTHEACRYCAFDSLCPADRGQHAEAKGSAVDPLRRSLAWEPGEESPT